MNSIYPAKNVKVVLTSQNKDELVCSEDDTDWEEATSMEGNSRALTPMMDSAKLEVVETLMKDFWMIFNQNSGGIQPHMPAESGETQTAIDDTAPAKAVPSKTPSKRARGQAEDDSGDEENGQRRKRQPRGFQLPKTAMRTELYACPYRKHNSRKYCVQSWRYCALTPHNTIARVKLVKYFFKIS